MKKKSYENPESELIIVRLEGNFCGTNVTDSPSNGFGDNNLGDLDDDGQ